MKRIALTGAMICCLSCVRAPAEPPPVAAVEVPAVVMSAEAPEASASAATIPAPAAVPERLACLVQGKWRGTKWQTHLYLPETMTVFAELSGGDARLRFPVGTRQRSQPLEIEDRGIVLRGVVNSDDVKLRATRPFLLSGLALPTPSATFDWTDGAEGELAVTTMTPNKLEVLGGPLSARRPCADLGLERTSFDATRAVDAKSKRTPKDLVTGHAIDIALEAGGPVVARANAGPTEQVEVLETRKSQSRIAWAVGDLIVVGWVANQDLHKSPPGVGYGTGSGRLGVRQRASGGKRVSCPSDVPLLVEVGGVQATVGLVRAHTTIALLARSNDYVTIAIDSELLSAAEGATWLMRTADVDACPSSP